MRELMDDFDYDDYDALEDLWRQTTGYDYDDRPTVIEREEKTKHRLRRKYSFKKYGKRKAEWIARLSSEELKKVGSLGTYKEHKLKSSGNPFKTEAEYRGDREFRREWNCVSSTPHQYSKDEWRAKKLDEEVGNYIKGVEE